MIRLAVTDWDKLYENNRTRQLKRMLWVPIPNSHDGDGYTELVDCENGAAHFGAWCAILQVASKCEPRGVLVRSGNRPHDAESIARLTRLPASVIAEALPRLLKVRWLSEMEESRTTVRDERTQVRAKRTTVRASDYEGKGREGKEVKEVRGSEAATQAPRRPLKKTGIVDLQKLADSMGGD